MIESIMTLLPRKHNESIMVAYMNKIIFKKYKKMIQKVIIRRGYSLQIEVVQREEARILSDQDNLDETLPKQKSFFDFSE